jgi:integrase
VKKKVQRKNPTIFPYRGKYRLQYVDSQGRNRTKTALNKHDAYKELVRLEQQLLIGTSTAGYKESPNLTEWLETWLKRRQSEVRITTFLGLESTVRLHIVPTLGQRRLDEVFVQHIEQLYASLLSNKGLSPATVRKVHVALGQAFSMAVRYGFLPRSPIAEVRVPAVRVSRKDTFDAQEVRLILDTASAISPRTYARFLLALRLGMRQGERLALNWNDLDLAQGLVRITKSVDAIPGLGAVVTPPKSAQSYREVPMDSETLLAFIKYKESISSVNTLSDLVFPSRSGNHANARVDYDAWKRLLRRARVRSLKLHDARHSAATLMLASGADARSIQFVLGHSSPGFTLATYVHPNTSRLREVLENSSKT